MPGFTRFGSARKRLVIIMGIVLAVIAGWVVLSHMHAARPCKEVSEVAGHISRQLQSGVAVVDMGRATDFPWDEMFVFNPYYPKDGICKALKLSPHECSEAHISDVDEGEFLLVFMLRGTISETVRLINAGILNLMRNILLFALVLGTVVFEALSILLNRGVLDWSGIAFLAALVVVIKGSRRSWLAAPAFFGVMGASHLIALFLYHELTSRRSSAALEIYGLGYLCAAIFFYVRGRWLYGSPKPTAPAQ